MKRTLIAVHEGLANVYNQRIHQYVRPELCIKLETTTKKYGKLTYYVQLLGYYYNTLPGLAVYSKFEDFLSMIYKEQTIDNLAAAKKCQYVVYLPKNYKANSNEHAGINTVGGGILSKKRDHRRSSSLSSFSHNLSSSTSGDSPYEDPKCRVSATHWNMIKEYDVCAMNPMNPKLPMISCFTPRLEKLADPQKTLKIFIWISYILHYLFIDYKASNKRVKMKNLICEFANYKPLYNGTDAIEHKFNLHEMGGFRIREQKEICVSFPFRTDKYSESLLPIRPWNKTLPYIFNTICTCSDGEKYFCKKLDEAKLKIKLRKIGENNYLKDPSGIDYVTAIKGMAGVYMKMSSVGNNKYYNKILSLLNEALLKDTRDTLKCRYLKLKCLLYNHHYSEYLKELTFEKFYDEKKLHRIDSTLSWNVSFCYCKLYGNKHEKTINSIKKSIQNHSSMLFVLIQIRGANCTNLRNQRDLNRHITFYKDYGQFWLSDIEIYKFIINDCLYYYLDLKSRPLTKYTLSKNRPFTLDKTPLLHEPHCINACKLNPDENNEALIQCKTCHTTYFCNENCEKIAKNKKHAIECEMIKKCKRIYKHYKDLIFIKNEKNSILNDEKERENENEKNENELTENDYQEMTFDTTSSDDEDDENNPFHIDEEENHFTEFMKTLQEDNIVNIVASSKNTNNKKRKSIEKKIKSSSGTKRRGSIELPT